MPQPSYVPNNHIHHDRSKLEKEKGLDNTVEFSPIPTGDNLADIPTEALGTATLYTPKG
jgi:hypothetical protein